MANANENNMLASNDPFLTRHEVAEIVAKDLRLSAAHVYDRYMAIPEFPKPVNIESATGRRPRRLWLQSVISNYLAEKRRAA
jgi:predicted DNA-binding transcriptional regulator AlpA